METFLTLAIAPFIIGTAIMFVGHVLHETVGGWENARGMAAGRAVEKSGEAAAGFGVAWR